ncbi:hypothetical protein C0995_005920 [Termitomyces sp. Mi166|nr:hypothetical protein C0995_005920 [Termitomyces sp. Mi166\
MESTWSAPEYDTSRPPSLTGEVRPHNDFARVAKWCADGSTFLAQCEDRSLQLFAPSEPRLVLPQPSPILDFLWYPTASPLSPASYCFLASVRDCPIKLLDASDGRLRASYRIVDHRERHVAPHSLSFNPTAERLYCGFEDAIEVFDVSRPGSGTRLPTTPSKKSKDGLKGIVSALAFVPSHGSDTYAAGTLTRTSSNIALFTETQGPEPIMFVSGAPSAGVTQINFNPLSPHIMYTAHRRHASIYAWDLRTHIDAPMAVYTPGTPSHSRDAAGRTNQKLRFDIDIGGRWLASGDHHGHISIFDLYSHGVEDVHPVLQFPAHDDSDTDSDSDSDTRTIRRTHTRIQTLDWSIKTWSFEI